MDLFKGNQGKGEGGFTLIELLVVIAILAVLAAVAIPAYSRFFGAGEAEANASELSNIQAAMDAMMAYHRITVVDKLPPGQPTSFFFDQPTLTSTEAKLQCLTGTCQAPALGEAVDDTHDYENLHAAFLRIGGTNSPTKCEYHWDTTGFVHQMGENDPLLPCVSP